MQNIPPQQAKKRYFSLSGPLQDALFSDRTSDSIRKAAILGGVEEKAPLLARLTGYVLLGYLNPLAFKDELKNELGLSEESAKQVAAQLDAEVFSPISSDLRKLYPPTIKTPTAASYGFSPNSNMNEAKKVLNRGPSEFEKRFFKKKEEQEKEAVKKTDKTAEEKKETAKPFFEKHEIGEHNLKVFEKIHQEKKEAEKQDEIKEPEKKEIKKELNPASLVSKKINESIKAVESKTEKKESAEKKKEETPIKPVMPLPTFMQSQFQPKRTTDNASPKLDGNVIDLRDL